jgi:DNA-binding NtrC family response regulator
MSSVHVLVLDANPNRRSEIEHLFKTHGYLPVAVPDRVEAARALSVPGLDLAVVDLNVAGIDQAMFRESLAPAEASAPEPLDAVERRHIARTLDFTRGNKRRAAHMLGIARSTLLAKVRKYGLEGADSNGEA